MSSDLIFPFVRSDEGILKLKAFIKTLSHCLGMSGGVKGLFLGVGFSE